jgi:hypothetical protein
MHNYTRAFIAFAAVATCTVATAAVPSVASAAPTEKISATVRAEKVSRDSLLKVARKGDKVAKSERSAAKVRQFLDEEAQRGNLRNEADVYVAEVNDPVRAGKKITVAWASNETPPNVMVQSATAPEGTELATAFALETVPESQETTLQPAGIAGGSGFAPAASPKNMYEYTANIHTCTNVWFTGASGTDHKLETCYEKWAQRGTSHWVYNRWAYFTRTPTNINGEYTSEFTIRSRPWNTKKDLVYKLNRFVPTDPTNSCQDRGNLTLGGTYSGVTGSVAIPVRTCSTTILKSDYPSKMIGIAHEGSEPARQIRLDIAGDYLAKDSVVVPVFADYAWVTLSNWAGIGKDFLWKETGW